MNHNTKIANDLRKYTELINTIVGRKLDWKLNDDNRTLNMSVQATLNSTDAPLIENSVLNDKTVWNGDSYSILYYCSLEEESPESDSFYISLDFEPEFNDLKNQIKHVLSQ